MPSTEELGIKPDLKMCLLFGKDTKPQLKFYPGEFYCQPELLHLSQWLHTELLILRGKG